MCRMADRPRARYRRAPRDRVGEPLHAAGWRERAPPSGGGPAAHTRATGGLTTNAWLDQAARGHRGRLTGADYQVIEHAHADELQRIAQLPSDVAVRCGRLGHA